ncbi:MAG: hypothetical protein WA919_29655 [Coleofasciculaceae cyanobacterium]
MQILIRLIGFFLLIAGISLLSNEVDIFNCWLRKISNINALITIAAAALSLVLSRRIDYLGWTLAAMLVVLAFASGCIQMELINLWYFILGLIALGYGQKILITGRAGRTREPVHRKPPSY